MHPEGLNMEHFYKTSGTCSSAIRFRLEDGRVYGVEFAGGCNGNLKAIGKLTEGMEAQQLVDLLSGNTCGFRPTSCADQLARAVKKAMDDANGQSAPCEK